MALPCLQLPSGPQFLLKHLGEQSKQWLQRLLAFLCARRRRKLRKEPFPPCQQNRSVQLPMALVMLHQNFC